MTTTWASPADTHPLLVSSESHWCSDCSDDQLFDRPGGPDAPEACCTVCGSAVFLWLDDAAAWDETVPLAA